MAPRFTEAESTAYPQLKTNVPAVANALTGVPGERVSVHLGTGGGGRRAQSRPWDPVP
ncbi:hypothetical protein GCM10009560_55800 [Nonomuraea longicatena]|uniref:Uncharacterized protein n=1 Tax=Nonomuraea longicatena TaxID=83682 RepID=A0ABN1QI24_9ACTN